jgi:DNA-binding response OmpR family regulator
VLVIEEAPEAGRRLVEALARAGLPARVCGDASTGLQAFFSELPDLIVARAPAADPGGRALLRELRAISDVPVVLIGGFGSEPVAERGIELGGDRILPASVEVEEVARLAAENIAGRTGGIGWDAVLTAVRAGGGTPKRLTAAQVRRLARSELAAELERQLVECRGNLAEMARRMGKDRSTIRYHLRRFGMLVEDRALRVEAGAQEGGDANRPPA